MKPGHVRHLWAECFSSLPGMLAASPSTLDLLPLEHWNDISTLITSAMAKWYKLYIAPVANIQVQIPSVLSASNALF